MQCPLCGGPLRIDDANFVCERRHELDADQMRVATANRVSAALWMAIEALETEAVALHSMEPAGAENPGGLSMAEQAEEDARILRELASKHVPPNANRASADE